MKGRTGVVFGVFDGLHEGHRHLLTEARKLCDELVVVLTAPEMALFLKGRPPQLSYDDRAAAIRDFDPGAQIVQSDKKPGAWSVFRQHPDALAILGYDQQAIAGELDKVGVPFVFIGSHRPDKFKSSLLRQG